MQKEELDCLHTSSAKQPASVPQVPRGRLPSQALKVMSLLGATCLGKGKEWERRVPAGKNTTISSERWQNCGEAGIFRSYLAILQNKKQGCLKGVQKSFLGSISSVIFPNSPKRQHENIDEISCLFWTLQACKVTCIHRILLKHR